MINVTILTFLSSIIPFSIVTSRHSPAYGVYMSQLIRYSRTCNSYHDFQHRSILLTRKLLNQGFIETRLRSTLKTFFFFFWSLPSFDTPLKLFASQWPPWLMTSVGHDIVVISTFHSLIRHRGHHNGCRVRSRKCLPSGAADFTSGFHRSSCCPVICASLFHVIVLSFWFWVLIAPFVWLRGISILFTVCLFSR